MKPLPIRQGLTLWYFITFALAALLLSSTSWWMLRHTLDATIHQDLQERLDDIHSELEQLGPDLNLAAAQAYFAAAYRDRDDGKWLQIRCLEGDCAGRTLYRSPRMAGLLPLPLPPQPIPLKPVIVEGSQGIRRVRLLIADVVVNGRTYSVETGISMKKPRALLHNFGLCLLLLTPGVILIAAAVGQFMSRKALAPVALIAHQARRISDRNLDRRLPVPETRDELSHLSITLNHMLERIDVAFRSVRDFTANASHELRTPLARIRTETEIALFRPRPAADYRQALEHVHQDAVDMSAMIENLLTIARAEAGREVLRLDPVDLGLLLQSILREWSPVAERLSLRLQILGVAPRQNQGELFVLGDRLSLVRLLRIWLDNACKFTSPGGSIAISAVTAADAVVLAVEDSGIGIAPEHQKRIFDRFYRVSGDTTRQTYGAGLGLSLAAWIADQHKTRIVLDSALGRGSRFQIKLTRLVGMEMAEIDVEGYGLQPVNK